MKDRPTTTPPSPEEFRTLLLRHKLKATAQRMAVHSAMLDLRHATAEDVATRLAEKGTVRIATASIYNILSQMALLGIYAHRLGRGGKLVFDVIPSAHIHLYDTVSNTWTDIEDGELMGMVFSRLGKRRFRGYRVDGIDISILCHPSQYKKK